MDEKTAISAAAVTSPSGSLNVEYVKSRLGLLKIGQMVLGLICWALIASVGGKCHLSSYQFNMFVTVTAWLTTIISFVIFLFGFNSGVGAAAPWSIIEFGHNAFWALFYFIASCVSAAYSCHIDRLIAATIISYFVTAFYNLHASQCYKDWKGHYPWQSGPSEGTHVSA